MKILISACLLGLPCRYDGASKPQLWVEELARRHELIPMCPEQMGGLPTPRNPSERRHCCRHTESVCWERVRFWSCWRQTGKNRKRQVK